jgi:hypothetical protein
LQRSGNYVPAAENGRGDNQGGAALPNRPAGIRKRNLDDIPDVKGRRRRAGRRLTTPLPKTLIGKLSRKALIEEEAEKPKL